MNLNELNNTIDFLQKLKIEEEKKQLEELNEKIKQELLNELENVLMHFESKVILEFRDKTKKDICFDYRWYEMFETIKEMLDVVVWECK